MKFGHVICNFLSSLTATTCIACTSPFSAYCQVQPDENQNIDSELTGLLPPQPSEKSNIEKPLAVSDVVKSVTINVERDYIPIDHMRGLLIKRSNESKHPLLFDCDAAKVIVKVKNQKSASLQDLEKVEGPKTGVLSQVKSDAKATVTAAFTVGAVPTYEGIKLQYGPILDRYGADEKRRQNEITRFGKRLLWPGESTTGIVYFNTDMSFVDSTLEISVSMPFSSDKASVATVSTKVQE